jgi:hypothetical protein
MTPSQLQQIAEEQYPHYDKQSVRIEGVNDGMISDYNRITNIERAAFIHGLTFDRFPLNFWERLEMFISNVEVNDPMSEEEKQMIISVCKSNTPPKTDK